MNKSEIASLTCMRKLSGYLMKSRGIEIPEQYLADDEKSICYTTLKAWGLSTDEKYLKFEHVLDEFLPSGYSIENISLDMAKYVILGMPIDLLEVSVPGFKSGFDKRQYLTTRYLCDKEFIKLAYAYSRPFCEYFKYPKVREKYEWLRKELLTPDYPAERALRRLAGNSLYDIEWNFCMAIKRTVNRLSNGFKEIVFLSMQDDVDIKQLQRPELWDDYGCHAMERAYNNKSFDNLAEYNNKTLLLNLAESRENKVTEGELKFLKSIEVNPNNYGKLESLLNYPSVSISSVKDYFNSDSFKQIIQKCHHH